MMNQSKQLLPIAIICALMAMPTMLAADILVLQSGDELKGRIVPTTDSSRVQFVRGMGTIQLPKNRIAEIREEDDAADFTHIGNQFIQLSDYSAAVEHFNKALESDPNFGPALEGLGRAQRSLDAMEQEDERRRQEELGQNLEQVPELIQNEAYESAEELITRVLDNDPTEDQSVMARRLLRDVYQAWAFARYDRLDYRGAEERYTKVLEMDPDNEEARDMLLRIWLRNPDKKEEVLEIYEQKLEDNPNDLEINKVVGELRYDMGEWKESIEPLKKVFGVTRFAGLGLDRKLEQAYKETIREHRENEEFGKAISEYQEMLQFFPNQNRDELLILQYNDQLKQLANDDYDGRAMLAKRLYERGLTSFAIRETELVLRYDPDNDIALSVLRQDAEERIDQIQTAMNEGQFLVARDMAESYIRNENRFNDLLEKAQELLNRADIEARRQARAIREQAREIAQRGIQYYNEALSFANRLASTEVSSNQRVISYKNEARIRAQRSIDHYNTAIRMDPSLAGIEGMDLNSRLRDARALHKRLTDPARRINTIDNTAATGRDN